MALKYKENTAANYYVYMLESGNDANDGLTPATAVKTVNRAVEVLNTYSGTKRRYCVSDRRRIYNESISVTRTNGKPITFEFLNRCFFAGGTSNVLFGGGGVGEYIINIVADYQPHIAGNIVFTYYNCIFLSDGSFTFTGGGLEAQNSRYFFCVFSGQRLSFGLGVTLINCVLKNSNQVTIVASINPQKIINTVIESPSLNIVTTGAAGSFLKACCVSGNIFVDGVSRNNAYLQSIGWNTDGIGADPKFNDPTNNVYTVNSDSPCLYAGTQNQHIGIGEAFYLSATDLLTDAVDSDNVELSSGKIIRTDVDLDGYVETKVFHNGTNRIISMIDLAATLGYLDEDVIQSVQLDSADASNPYPAFLTFKMKVGETESACNSSDWITLPFNQRPVVDESGVGNGSEDIDTTETWSSIKINYFKLYIYITNP